MCVRVCVCVCECERETDAHTPACARVYIYGREGSEGRGLTWSPGRKPGTLRMEDVVRALGCFLLFCLAGSPPPCTFSRFALTHHSSPGGGLQRKVIYSRPLPFPPIWPRAWPRVGSAWAHPPASLLPGCHLAGVLDQGGPVAGVQVLPSCSPGGLGPPTPVAQRPPHRGGCAGSEGSPCEDARRQCSVNISPTVIGGSAAVRTQE